MDAKPLAERSDLLQEAFLGLPPPDESSWQDTDDLQSRVFVARRGQVLQHVLQSEDALELGEQRNDQRVGSEDAGHGVVERGWRIDQFNVGLKRKGCSIGHECHTPQEGQPAEFVLRCTKRPQDLCERALRVEIPKNDAHASRGQLASKVKAARGFGLSALAVSDAHAEDGRLQDATLPATPGFGLTLNESRFADAKVRFDLKV